VPDDLDVVGGTSSVSTEDLAVASAQLGRLSRETRAMCTALGQIPSEPTPGIYNTGQARLDIDHAQRMLDTVSQRAWMLEGIIRVVAQGYIVSERLVEREMRALQSGAAQWLGSQVNLLPIIAGPLGGMVLAVSQSLRATKGLDPVLGRIFAETGIPKASPFARENNHLWNNEGVVAAMRRGTHLWGSFAMGACGVPVGFPVPERKQYLFGATALLGAGRGIGLLNETPVRLVETQQLPPSAAPHDYHGRLQRVPHEELGQPGPQVMIERYSVPGEPDRFSVYVGGTVTFNPGTTTEPWDMTSNMVNAAGEESGSAASVRAAMRAAGIDENSPVQFTGFSQGGGTVAAVVASEDYNTRGVVTFGGPTGQVDLPDGVPTVLVEHSDDPVPALGGEQDNGHAVLVRRDVFGGENVDKTWAVPSHHIEYYLRTAQLMDESRSPQLDATMRKLDSFTAGATLESSTSYRFERVTGKD